MHSASTRSVFILSLVVFAISAPGCGTDPDAILENLEVIGLTPGEDASTDDPADDPNDADNPSADSTDEDPAGDEPTGTGDDGGNDAGDPAPGDSDPVVDACAVAASEGGASFEEQVLELVNAERAAGADCGSAGVFDPAGPLTMNADLRCAARTHSQDMVDRDYFDHTNPDGESPGDRIDATGYQWRSWGENIAWGQPAPEAVVDAWMNSDGHCSNIMNAGFTEIGVGYAEGSVWTQVFATPR